MKLHSLTAIAFAMILAGSPAAAAAAGFPYYAQLRDSNGRIITDETVNVCFSILDGATDGTAVYVEEQEARTDVSGAINTIVGLGEATIGSFEDIDWSEGPRFMKVEVTSGSDISLCSVQEMLSTPIVSYADGTASLEYAPSSKVTYRLAVDDYGKIEMIQMPAGYSRLVFNDSFNGTGLPDADKWSPDPAHINEELQYYTSDRVENVYQKDGMLHIRCINNDPIYDEDGNVKNVSYHPITGEELNITSARIRTKGKGDWTYCYVESRMKVPVASGTWPALWMMPTDNAYGYWPNSGEIDIMEHIGNEPQTFHCALHHYSGVRGGEKQVFDYDDWHIIGFKWTPEKMEFLIDGKIFCRLTNPNTNWGDWPYDKRFHLILNLAFGGNWGGQKGVDPSALPLEFLVDYMRVFQE